MIVLHLLITFILLLLQTVHSNLRVTFLVVLAYYLPAVPLLSLFSRDLDSSKFLRSRELPVISVVALLKPLAKRLSDLQARLQGQQRIHTPRAFARQADVGLRGRPGVPAPELFPTAAWARAWLRSRAIRCPCNMISAMRWRNDAKAA